MKNYKALHDYSLEEFMSNVSGLGWVNSQSKASPKIYRRHEHEEEQVSATYTVYDKKTGLPITDDELDELIKEIKKEKSV